MTLLHPRLGEIARRVTLSAVAITVLLLVSTSAFATKIDRIITPGGIEAWLVSDSTVPLIAIEFAFRGGSSQDPAGRPGVANLTAALLDEGAGELDSKTFQQRMEDVAMTLHFSASRDLLRGSMRTLTEHREEAFGLLRLALTAPRFDTEDVERIRGQVLSRLRRETTSPHDIASKRWWAAAFPGHPYGHQVSGTLESVPQITRDELKDYVGHLLARDQLKIGIVGDIDAGTAASLIDRAFGALPATAALFPVPEAEPQGGGQRILVDLDVPQAVVNFGGAGISRKDPDFMAAYIVNHILGGGSFSSRLYREVREIRGLAYSVSSSLMWFNHAAIFVGATATRAERAGESLTLIEEQIRRLASEGPTEDELAKAKSYLKGSYPLAFDTSGKIAGQLVQIQVDELGIDYINRRSALIEAVTLDDVKRVAKRLLDRGMLVTIVGRPQGVTATPTGG